MARLILIFELLPVWQHKAILKVYVQFVHARTSTTTGEAHISI